jgi:hypothetical protein
MLRRPLLADLLLASLLLASLLHSCACVLLPRPVYPPAAFAQMTPAATAYPGLRAAGSPSGEDLLHCALATEPLCSCDDVFVLQRTVAKLQDQHRDLTRRTLRLESVLSELLESMEASDDVALLERRTCSAVVYNEHLTAARPLRLLRQELKRLRRKWAM